MRKNGRSEAADSFFIISDPQEHAYCFKEKSKRGKYMNYADLNCDLGESFGAYKIGNDEAVIPLITSANIACGFHAGDPVVMAKTMKLVKEAGVQPGAHPGYPDLSGFGRRNMKITPEEAKAYVIYQVGALKAFADAEGLTLQHVKPHGAFYNMAGKDPVLAKAICEGIASVSEDLIIMALSGSEMVKAAALVGIRAASEVFADRGYEEDGSLVARSKPGAMITDENEASARVIRMIREGKVRAVTGKDIDIRADSVCVHGDGAKALAFVERLREDMGKEGILLRPIGEFL